MNEYKIDYCHHDSVTTESRQEYIKREDVLARKGNCYDKDGHLLYAVGTGDIMRVPTADVVPVVRCKDCKHRKPVENCSYGDCIYSARMVDDDDYCSNGERKDNE